MRTARPQEFEPELRHFDAEMRRISDLRIDLSLPGPALRASLTARREERAAALSSDVPRFPPARSTRALLLDYARWFSA